ncbi:MAG: pseudouridine synthase [Bdellovibrionota bacterium]|nr:pseudouridine synthase [Bdellovibrionota bacterium]
MKNSSPKLMSKSLRLQKYIADCGFTSRRKAEDLIREGKVKVNGMISSELGVKVDPVKDVVSVDGQVLDRESIQKHYILMNKPRGVMTTLNDPEGRSTVMDYVKEVSERVYPVGRLDYLSEGLLLLTNDGEMANMIMHPSYNITKVYEVKVFGSVNDAILKKLRDGVVFQGHHLKPLSVRVIKQLPSKTWLEFRLGEGRNREIRNICEGCGLTVDKLRRVAIESLSIEDIGPGKYVFLTKKELLKALGMEASGVPVTAKRTYVSKKKSVQVKKRNFSDKDIFADDSSFRKFRKETYLDASKSLQEMRKKRGRISK